MKYIPATGEHCRVAPDVDPTAEYPWRQTHSLAEVAPTGDVENCGQDEHDLADDVVE